MDDSYGMTSNVTTEKQEVKLKMALGLVLLYKSLVGDVTVLLALN